MVLHPPRPDSAGKFHSAGELCATDRCPRSGARLVEMASSIQSIRHACLM